MNELTHLIANTWCPGTGESFQSINPSTGEVIWEGYSASSSEVQRTVSAARQALSPLYDLGFEGRYAALQNYVQKLEASKEQLAHLISEELGKPLWEATTEINAMIGKLAITLESYQERCMEKSDTNHNIRSLTRHKPQGILAVFGPFNFPGHLPNGHIIPAILAGNAIVFKPSEYAPKFSIAWLHCFNDIGLPKGSINMVQGGAEVGANLVSANDIDGVLFTGSAKTGLLLRKSLVNHPEKILALELGGNNPLVVGNVDDINSAIYMIIQSAFITAGQRCTCARRLIVLNHQHDELVSALVDATKRIKVGPYTELPEPFMGPVVSTGQASILMKAQQDMVANGATALLTARRMAPKSALLTPGILDVTEQQQREDVEWFGPLLQLIRVNSLEEAIAEANSTDYGLSAGLLSDDKAEYELFFKHIRAGIVNWNRPITGASSRAPFGGIGKSGNHRPSAYYAIDYCAYPVASQESERCELPDKLSPGIML